jgi:hypothetical protein
MSVQDLGVTINTKLLEHTKFYKSSKYISKSNKDVSSRFRYMEGGCCMKEGHKVPQIRWSWGGGSETCGMYQMHQHLSLPPEMA